VLAEQTAHEQERRRVSSETFGKERRDSRRGILLRVLANLRSRVRLGDARAVRPGTKRVFFCISRRLPPRRARLGDDGAEDRLEPRRAVLRGARGVPARQPPHGRGAGGRERGGARERRRQVRGQRVGDARGGFVETPLDGVAVDGDGIFVLQRPREARDARAPRLQVETERAITHLTARVFFAFAGGFR
jgi:hypothetical protein